MGHLSAGLVVDLARGLVSDPDPFRPHLRDCDECRRTLDRLSLLVRVASIGPPAHGAPPAAPTSAAPGRPLPLVPAQLVRDDILPPAPARTGGGRGEERHLVFEAAQWEVDLHVVRRDQALGITGQIANALAPDRGCAGVAVLGRSPEAVVSRSLTGPLGDFTVSCEDVAPLTLEIRVSSPPIAIGIPPRRD